VSGGSSSGGAGGKSSGGSGGASGGSGGSGSTTPGMSAGCGKVPTIASNMYNNGKPISMTVGSMQRRYILSVPTDYVNTKAYKLVIAYHQRDGNDLQMYANQYYHLQPLAKDTTIFVAPNGQLNGAPCSGMSAQGESSCGWPNPNDSDMNFADAMVKAVEESFCVDTNRIFATGWSYGGSMSYATACERPLGAANGYIRAIAVYSGSQLSGNCTPSKPVGYYASHGTSDSVLCYDGNSSGCQVGNGLLLAQNFAMANGCTWATPQKVTSGNHVCTTLMGCTSGYPEEFCSFNGDHTPDPRDPGQGNSWEYQKAWDFLNQF
jgi:poly(3-hydroxybutyrate) depolymerase